MRVPSWRFTRELRAEAIELVSELRPPATVLVLCHPDAGGALVHVGQRAERGPLIIEKPIVTEPRETLRHPSLALRASSLGEKVTWLWWPAARWHVLGQLDNRADWESLCARASAVDERLRRLLSSVYDQPAN